MTDRIELDDITPSLALVKPKRKYTRKNPLEAKQPKEPRVTANSYLNYHIDTIYTDERGSCIYFKDSHKSHLECFVFDFRKKQLLMENGEVAKASYVYKISNGIERVSQVASISGAPFWVVSYLHMITHQFTGYRSRIKNFYNAFIYKWEGPHPDILEIMDEAELIAKAGFCINITRGRWGGDTAFYQERIAEFKKSISVMKSTSGLWQNPYEKSKGVVDNKSFHDMDTFLAKFKLSNNSSFQLMLREFAKYNEYLPNVLGDMTAYRIGNLIECIEYLNKLGYDSKRLAKYLANDLDYQGIEVTQISQNSELLKDYARMSYETLGNTKFSKYPNFLKTQHDIAQKNYRVKQDKDIQEKFRGVSEETASKLPNLTVKDKTYVILVPQSSDEIIREGAKQHHCVASYVKNVANRTTTILFMRDKKMIEEPLITIEVKNLFIEEVDSFISQAKGNSNRSVTEEEYEFLKVWAKKNNISYGND